MEAFAVFVKETVPKYLKALPIPKSLDHVEKLTGDDWLQLSLFLLGLVIVVMSILNTCLPSRSKKPCINNTVEKENPKVATLMDVEDLGEGKSAFCRCWKSKKFPMCDGSHGKHNKETGDNVGPLVMEKKPKEAEEEEKDKGEE